MKLRAREEVKRDAFGANPRCRSSVTAPRGGVKKRRAANRRSVVPSQPPKTPRQPQSRPRSARTARSASTAQTPRRSASTAQTPTSRQSARLQRVSESRNEKAAADLVVLKEEEIEEEDERTKTIDDLPEEIMLGIFSYFRPPQLCWKIGRVCRQWATWSVSPFLWKNKEYVLSPDPNMGLRRKK